MRGADELAHFIRVYGLSQGEIIPRITDAEKRKGIFIPASLERQMAVFEAARKKLNESGFSYRDVFASNERLRVQMSTGERQRKVFKRYDGSEGYSPIPYLAYLPAVAAARLLDLDFLTTIYLTRTTGFVLLTALLTLAIAIVPGLQWSFLLIAMLPSALFARATLSGDSASLALTMLVAALSLRGALGRYDGSVWTRTFSMSLCTLAKPPQIAFVLLELMRRPLTPETFDWRAHVIVTGPAVILPVMWAILSGADVAVWRMLDGTEAAEHFDPIWKLQFMATHPLHFVGLLLVSLPAVDQYWVQLIGVLGWADMPLQPWAYPLLSLSLGGVLAAPLGADAQTRLRIGIVAAMSALGYCLALFLIFYLVWTGLDDDHIYGVQGRYFLVVLPLAAIALSALVNRGLPMRGCIAISGAMLSGGVVIEAILRTDWRILLPI